ncbi:MAG: B12-binding domain-containing radical SAM protein [Magnetococcales bacterium]|nr:B12-binding domain-containing radical SAM protein [Magnetococcales bacterium]MBF0630928.1 B12-binding domain-containing radical SAM protein [Magnetococcales bacterium]
MNPPLPDSLLSTPVSGGIILTTLNARYRHAALGLRCLKANLAELAPYATIMEFDIHHRPLDIAEALLQHRPAIIGIGVYVWNLEPVTHLLAILNSIVPETIVVLGGPEAGYAPEDASWHAAADIIITGEGEWVFRDLCREFYAKGGLPRLQSRRIIAPPVDLSRVVLPYSFYDAEDVKHRFTYVEASRGCPHGCSFCLSAHDAPVRTVDMPAFLAAMGDLLHRGARQFKFVDRTFNLNTAHATAILDFFLERMCPGLFVHFEMIPDRLPQPLKDRLVAFPQGSIQLEIGLQTFDPPTRERIHRRQDDDAAERNLSWLRTHTRVHLHADLILGLPGESVTRMGAGFDRLLQLGPHEIQVGILKRLHGTPLARSDRVRGMVFNPVAPYDLLASDQIDFPTMQRLRRFARYWDLIGNSGRFPGFVAWLGTQASPFASFMTLSDWLFATIRQTHEIAQARLFKLVHQGLVEALMLDPLQVRQMIDPEGGATSKKKMGA